MKATRTFVSLFSGCGGLDLGMTTAGATPLFATDLEPLCAESHGRNFPGVPFFCGNVSNVSEAVLRKAIGGKLKGAVDIVVGGPPCPPFSKSRFYRMEKPRALEDPVGLETFTGYLNTLRILRPRAFILENVAGLAYDVHRPALDEVLRQAGSLGYTCTWQVLNAANYGVPQIRERCFVVGMLDHTFSFPNPTHAQFPDSVAAPRKLKAWETAGNAIGPLDTEENASDEGHFAGGKHHALLREIPPGDNYLFFTEERGHPNPQFKWRSRYWSFLLKLSPEKPSWTIQARRSNNMGPLHWRNRILRIQEVMRLQTFPTKFYLAGNVEQQWRQVGNAVPPRLAKVIGAAVIKQLEGRR